MIGWADTHCHIGDGEFDADREAVLERAHEAGVDLCIVPGVDLGSSRSAVRLAETHAEIWAAVGFHPHSAGDWNPDAAAMIRELARSHRVVAVGEIGLDFRRMLSPQADQERAFRDQLELAAECGLPVILHQRESMPRMIEMLTEASAARGSALDGRRGVFHAFPGDRAAAERAIREGFYLGVAGPVTFPKSEQARDVFSSAPLESLLVETDAPYLAPQAHRGKRNEPAFLPLIGEELARVREIEVPILREATGRNARRLFSGTDGTDDRNLL